MIVLVEGGVYIDGRGKTVGPLVPSSLTEPFYLWMYCGEDGKTWHYSEYGRSYPGAVKHPRDIVSVVYLPAMEQQEVWTGEWVDAE